MSEINYMDIKTFRRLGLLQELNRQFLHPLGLALEVVVEDDGSERFGNVWDYRDDPEGIVFTCELRPEAAHNVEAMRLRHSDARQALFEVEDPVQPIGWKKKPKSHNP